MQTKHLNSISIAAAIRQIRAAFTCNNKVALVGSPGIGKTSICGPVAESLGLAYLPIIGVTLDRVDVGGLPAMQNGEFVRVVMKALRRACEEPCLIVWEEVTCLPPDVQAALLDVLFSGKVGDGTPLHPETRQLALWNPVEQAPNASEPAASLINRFSPIVVVRPTVDEVADYFNEVLGADDANDPAGLWFRDFAATLGHVSKHGLVQLDPPDASINEGAPWGSPRAWEYGLRQVAALEALGRADGLPADEIANDVFHGLAGTVGNVQAQSYLAVRKLRDQFPTIDEIVKDPANAKLPERPETQIGALGLLQEVAYKDAYAAWIYAARCREEIGQAAARALTARQVPKASPHKVAGNQARVKLMSRIGHRRSRRNAAA